MCGHGRFSSAVARPRLGSPDAAQELEALQEQEGRRSQEVTAAIADFRRSMLANETQAAKQFVARLAAATKALALLLDSLPASEDLADNSEVRRTRQAGRQRAMGAEAAGGEWCLQAENEAKRKSMLTPTPGKKGAAATEVTVRRRGAAAGLPW